MRQTCTCCDGDEQGEDESARLVYLGHPDVPAQDLCGFCAMICGANRELEALGLEVVAHLDQPERRPS